MKPAVFFRVDLGSPVAMQHEAYHQRIVALAETAWELESYFDIPDCLLSEPPTSRGEHHWRRLTEPFRPLAFTYTDFSPPPVASGQQRESIPRTVCYPAPSATWSISLRHFDKR